MNIFIYGVPGSGKTTLAKLLGESLDQDYFEADLIRNIIQKGKTIEKEPFYFLPTTESYKALGERTQENVISGMLNVRVALKDSVDKKIFSYKQDVIFESSFLDPKSLKSKGLVILLTIPSDINHKKQFLVHRTEKSFTNGQYENARMIQNYFISEAKKLGIIILENSGDIDNLIKRAKKILKNKIRKKHKGK